MDSLGLTGAAVFINECIILYGDYSTGATVHGAVAAMHHLLVASMGQFGGSAYIYTWCLHQLLAAIHAILFS